MSKLNLYLLVTAMVIFATNVIIATRQPAYKVLNLQSLPLSVQKMFQQP